MSLTMKRWRFREILMAGTLSMCTVHWVASANFVEGATAEATVSSEVSPDQVIQQALLEENQGKPVDRNQSLGELKTSSKDAQSNEISKVVRWQTGEVNLDGVWLPVEELEENKLPAKVKRYLKLKSETTLDGPGHRKLALHCQESKLKEQADSHWYGVLSFDPQNREARQALGFVNYGNRWVSREEALTAEAASKSVAEACKKWAPQIRKWALAIEGKDTKKKLEAIRALKAVSDPGIVHAARLAVPHVSSTTATHLVQTIRQFQNRDAAQALAAIAIQDLASEASQAAVEGLKEYPLESFAPDLLDLMATETTLEQKVVTQPNGALVLQLVQEREWRNERSYNWLDKQLWAPMQTTPARGNRSRANTDRRAGMNRGGPRGDSGISESPLETRVVVAPNSLVVDATQGEAKRILQAAQAERERENSAIKERQKNISAVLRGVTGAPLKEDAEEWWAWWDAQQESYLDSEKPVKYAYQRDTSSTVYRPQRLTQVSDSIVGPAYDPPPRRDCLIAGTLISTETGMVPVEKISIGDRVLSQNIETGELTLKPVIRTAIRPPAPTLLVEFSSGESLQSTLGHPWWVVGQGWVKTRDLKEGMFLRTPSASVEIVKIAQAEVVQTYNLVVADNNSYFAGNDRILSYDGNELVHTFQRVPGLPADSKSKKDKGNSVASTR